MQEDRSDPHPQLLAAVRELEPAIRAAADRIEAERRVPDAIVQGMHDAGILRMLVPRAYGGGEVDPLTAFEVIEELSRVDGSTGWVAMIAAGTPAFIAAWLEPDVAEAVFVAAPRAMVVGALAPMGRAVEVDGGYRVSGRWPFGSGSEHAAWLLSGSVVYDGDQPRLDEQGKPQRRMLLLRQSDCEILDTWHVAGLRGTGSHDYTASDVFVPRGYAVVPGQGTRYHDGPLYDANFLLIAHAAHALGVARHAIEAFGVLAARGAREKPLAQLRAAQAEALVGAARTYVVSATSVAWEAACAGEDVTPEHRVQIRLAMTHAVQSSSEAVRLVYDAAGGAAIYEANPLARCFRDIHVATQHAVVATPSYEMLGRALLGLDDGAGAL